MLKVLFINAVSSNSERKFPPLGQAYIVSYVRKYYDKQVEFRIIDKNPKKEIDIFKPDIVGISSVSQNYGVTKEIAAYSKSKGIFTIVGGIHISMLPMTLDKNMDLGVLSEGEQTFLEIIQEYEKNNSRINYEEIKGIIYWKDGKIIHTPKRELIKDLDSIPPPARDLLNVDKRTIYLFSSRGCPYRCIFCATSRYWNTVRLNSAEYVVEEIKMLVKKYNVKSIAFLDDLFIVDKERLKKIGELLEKSSLDISINVQARANLINEEILTLLKKMKTKTVMMGLESGNNRVLQYLKGKNVTLEDNERAVKLIKKFGFDVVATFVMGAPTETREEVLDTLDFIKRNVYDFFIFLLTPFPGTPIWDYAVEKGLVSNDMDWYKLEVKDYNNLHNKIILSETMDADELQELYQKFEKVKKISKIKFLLKEGLKRPGKIMPFLLWKSKKWYSNIVESDI